MGGEKTYRRWLRETGGGCLWDHVGIVDAVLGRKEKKKKKKVRTHNMINGQMVMGSRATAGGIILHGAKKKP